MQTGFAIAGRPIGPGEPPFIIAELSGNHNGRLERALELIDAAAAAGADAVKLQTYTADTITLDHDGPGFLIEEGLWAGRTLHDLYAEAFTPYEWHAALFERARQRGVIAFSSPFDETAVELLEGLGAPAFKIASFEAVDLPLIARAARSTRPLIISTGMTSQGEIEEAVRTALQAGASVALLHCVSAYPARHADANLRMIPRLAADFGCPGGPFGSHPGNRGVRRGGRAGRLHHRKARDPQPRGRRTGRRLSLELPELAALVRDCRDAWEALGAADYRRGAEETANRQFRRSLYVVRDVKRGARLTPEDVRSIRPGFGLEPKRLGDVLGRAARRDLSRGEPVTLDMLD